MGGRNPQLSDIADRLLLAIDKHGANRSIGHSDDLIAGQMARYNRLAIAHHVATKKVVWLALIGQRQVARDRAGRQQAANRLVVLGLREAKLIFRGSGWVEGHRCLALRPARTEMRARRGSTLPIVAPPLIHGILYPFLFVGARSAGALMFDESLSQGVVALAMMTRVR
ncbi:MAG: hypothetical protein HC802_01410 [Caldilineaceae bacterium]|nr:hypothetical protein [Caldilineaceae bacterium]